MMHGLLPFVAMAGLTVGAITTQPAPVDAPAAVNASDTATGAPTGVPIEPATFIASERAVSTWRSEAVKALDLTPAAAADLAGGHESSPVARCVKLNNYWCIKKAGWTGEIAADGEGHVAFSTATEGAAVAALLLKRYYVDFNRKTALAIVARWAPAQCGGGTSIAVRRRGSRAPASAVIRSTLRARWLAAHARGSAKPIGGGKKTAVAHSIVIDRVPRLMPTPTIAVGLGEVSTGRDRVLRPITLDALQRGDPHALPSRTMLGLSVMGAPSANMTTCAGDAARVASYAGKAATGIEAAPDGDLGLFDASGAPTDHLAIVMANMARVEIGPLGASAALIKEGIAAAFKPGRNPS